MTKSSQYIKIVEWSEEDQSYVGYCPGVIGPCCHGDDEVEVFRDLCQIVDEWLDINFQDKQALPAPTVGKNVAAFLYDANSMVDRNKEKPQQSDHKTSRPRRRASQATSL